VRLHKFQRVLESLQVLSDARLSRAVASVLERQVFVHDDTIIWHGEKGTGLYFIAGGAVEVLMPQVAAEHMKKAVGGAGGASTGTGDVISKLSAIRKGEESDGIVGCVSKIRDAADPMSNEQPDTKVITRLETPSFFGEMALLNQGGTAVASVRANVFCEAYHLSIHAYEQLLVSFPAFKSYIETVARMRLEAMTSTLNAPLAPPTPSPNHVRRGMNAVMRHRVHTDDSPRHGPMRLSHGSLPLRAPVPFRSRRASDPTPTSV